MANKKYKLTDGNYWATDGVYDFDQGKTQREVNSDLSGAITSVEKGLAIIVTGDTCSTAVPSGGYAYIKNNTHGLTEGLYRNKSSSAFPTSGGTANSTVFEAVSVGGLNDLVSVKTGAITPTDSATTIAEMRAVQVGKVCQLQGYLTGNFTAGTNVRVATLSGITPPSQNIRTITGCGNTAYTATSGCYLYIGTNGDIYVTTGMNCTTINIAVTYVI